MSCHGIGVVRRKGIQVGQFSLACSPPGGAGKPEVRREPVAPGEPNFPSGAGKEGVPISGTVRTLRAAWACSGVLDDIALRTGDHNKGPRENAAGEPSRPRRSRRIPGRPRGPGAPPCETDRPRRAEASPRRTQAPARRHRAEFPDSVLRKCTPICLADMFWSRTWRAGDSDNRT